MSQLTKQTINSSGTQEGVLNESLLRASDVVVKFGSQSILRSVSLDLKRGSQVNISGRSGAGKSTLLHAISGLVEIQSGLMDVLGSNVQLLSDRERSMMRRRIGFMFQQSMLFDELSVLGNVSWAGQLRGLSLRQSLLEGETILEMLGLGDLREARVGRLSGGESQRVNLARALVGDVDLLLIDEPTAALDEDRSHSVCKAIQEAIREMGLAAIVVSHDPIAAKYADRRLQLVEGVLCSD